MRERGGMDRSALGNQHSYPLDSMLRTSSKTMKYTVVLEREPDGGFVASVPLLPGCVSQGENGDEAITNIREAIELYVEDCRLAGDPIPQEDSREYVELRTGTR